MTFRFVGIDHVQLAAPSGCEQEARRFFGELLGMPELEKPEVLRKRGGVWFQCGAQQLHIGVQGEFVPALKAHPAFEVSGLDALRSKLEASGVPVVSDEPIAGVTRFHISDPFGNRIELVEQKG
ncbi:VOC family protein [Paenibacillus ginsengarvi]|uniref:Glyoxalase n=1 Tax=Paenibacillus ginsengarvi TaxID=400777 RepID=A0A3B0CEB2_9BACL|nr:VOC family protein [Paenibacillus ginsengarvi]RKN82087.1 glyoxalase [Paenibacillus ginsengarvi]